MTDAEITEFINALDEALIVSHIGSINSFNTPKEALYQLCQYEQGVGEFFAHPKLHLLKNVVNKAIAWSDDGSKHSEYDLMEAILEYEKGEDTYTTQLEELKEVVRLQIDTFPHYTLDRLKELV